MQIVCPGCKTRFSFDEKKVGAEGIRLRCSKCRAIFKVVRKETGTTIPSASPAAARSAAITVVVANESAAFCAAVKKVLDSEPFDVHTYNDGKAALAAIEQLRPEVVLLDVALPSMYGFEVCESVRKNPQLSSVKLILIASIYDKTRYKRSPQSLYGADDYIEKHHIPDTLTAMIYRLVSGQRPVDSPLGAKATGEEEAKAMPQQLSPRELTAQEAARRELRQDEEKETLSLPTPSAQEPSEAHLKARRLARIIVSDIVLYNQARVEEGIRNGFFYELLAVDIDEGRALYEKRVPEEVRRGTTYLDDAFDDLISRKRSELKL